MKRLSALACCAALSFPGYSAHSQPGIPVVDLVTSARSTNAFGSILGVAALANGHVLVNDAGHKQLVMLDQALTNARVVLDSAETGLRAYGNAARPLTRFMGDSIAFPDMPSRTLLLIDPLGNVGRSMAVPRANDMRLLLSGHSYTDSNENLYYRGDVYDAPTVPAGQAAPLANSSLAPILRASFEKRAVDTVATLRALRPGKVMPFRSANGTMRRGVLVNPLVSIDEWAVTSDGTVAVVRGRDYHVDWLSPQGEWKAGPAMQFDWKQVSEPEKIALVDSALAAEQRLDQQRKQKIEQMPAAMAALKGGKEGFASAGGGKGPEEPKPAVAVPTLIEAVPLHEIADYYPPIRTGAVISDLDNNIWILPTTSAQSARGELIYDVVDRERGLKYRVRVPLGRSIAGFGRNGTVYLSGKSEDGTWFLERAAVPRM